MKGRLQSVYVAVRMLNSLWNKLKVNSDYLELYKYFFNFIRKYVIWQKLCIMTSKVSILYPKQPDETNENYMLSEGIDWKFLPPRAQNFRGIWEARIQPIKYYFRRVVGNLKLT